MCPRAGSLCGVSEWAVQKAVKVKPKLQWRTQYSGDFINVECLLGEVVTIQKKQYQK